MTELTSESPDAQDIPAPVNTPPKRLGIPDEVPNRTRRNFLGLSLGALGGLALNALTGNPAGKAIEHIAGNSPDTETVIKANAHFRLVDKIHENGIDKPLVIRTSPRAHTVDNQLDEKQTMEFANKEIQGDALKVEGKGRYPGVYDGEWVRFKSKDEKGVERNLYVAMTFANELEQQPGS